MKELKLLLWNPESARQSLVPFEGQKTAYWLGAVSASNEAAVSRFISFAGKSDLESLLQFQDHDGGDMVYAVVVENEASKRKLLLVESPGDPALDERCILVKDLPSDLMISGLEHKTDDALARVRRDSKFGLAEILRSLFQK